MDRKAGLRHWPFYLALTGGLLSLPIGFAFFRAEAIEVAAILFFLIYLSITALRLPKLTAAISRPMRATRASRSRSSFS